MIPEDPIRIHEIPKGIQNPETGRDLKERENKKERSAEGPGMRKITPQEAGGRQGKGKCPRNAARAKEEESRRKSRHSGEGKRK